MSALGKTIQLTGVSQKGKNRVRENGNLWTVLAETDRVLFAPNSQGPWLFIVPRGCDQEHKAGRWIKTAGDADFVVILLDGLDPQVES